MAILSDDVVCLILQQPQLTTMDKIRCDRVSSQWHRVARSSCAVWSNFTISTELWTMDWRRALEPLLQRTGNTVPLDVTTLATTHTRLWRTVSDSFASRCHRLRTLHIGRFPERDAQDALICGALDFPALKSLAVNASHVFAIDMRCPCLKHLRLNNVMPRRWPDVFPPTLRSLKLVGKTERARELGECIFASPCLSTLSLDKFLQRLPYERSPTYDFQWPDPQHWVRKRSGLRNVSLSEHPLAVSRAVLSACANDDVDSLTLEIESICAVGSASHALERLLTTTADDLPHEIRMLGRRELVMKTRRGRTRSLRDRSALLHTDGPGWTAVFAAVARVRCNAERLPHIARAGGIAHAEKLVIEFGRSPPDAPGFEGIPAIAAPCLRILRCEPEYPDEQIRADDVLQVAHALQCGEPAVSIVVTSELMQDGDFLKRLAEEFPRWEVSEVAAFPNALDLPDGTEARTMPLV